MGNLYDRLAYIRILMSTECSKVDGPAVYEDTCSVPCHCSYPYWHPIYVFNSPLLCRQSDLWIKPKSSYPYLTEWIHLSFIFRQLYHTFFKKFSVMKWRCMRSGCKAAVFLNWTDLSSLLSSHCICAEDFFSPHCIEDCLGPRAGLGTVMKRTITSLACNWTPVAQPIASLLADSLRSINFYSKTKSSFIHFVQLVRWLTTNQLTWAWNVVQWSLVQCQGLAEVIVTKWAEPHFTKCRCLWAEPHHSLKYIHVGP